MGLSPSCGPFVVLRAAFLSVDKFVHKLRTFPLPFDTAGVLGFVYGTDRSLLRPLYDRRGSLRHDTVLQPLRFPDTRGVTHRAPVVPPQTPPVATVPE